MYVDKETSEVRYLQAFDFVLFALFMAVSAGIGVFYAIRAKRQGPSNRDYLLGNQELHVLPVAIAMVLSLASATSMLGMPAEVYMGGIEYIYLIAGVAVALLIAGWQFVPLFYDLKLTSSLEYLELRFKSKAAKLTATILIIIQSLFYLAVVMYSPSVALEAVTGFPVWLSILCVLVVSTIYTALGGLRAVVLTDAVQMVVIVSGFLALIIQGTVEVGGMDKVFDISRAGGRLEQIHFDFDLRVRHSFWSLVLGSAPQILVFSAVNPASVQRYKAVPTLTKARLVVFGSLLIWVVYISLVSLTGLVIFAYYSSKQCDPLRANYLKNINQIVPYYLMDTLYYPGVPGIYLASLFSGTLSSTSAVQVALAAVTWEDLLKAKYGHISERRKVVVCQCLVIFYGIISAGLAFMIGVVKGTTVIQLTIAFSGALYGPFLGMFLLGCCIPWSNWKGVVGGAIAGVIIALWVAFGSFTVTRHNHFLPTNTSGCDAENATTATNFTTPVISGVQLSLLNASMFNESLYETISTVAYREDIDPNITMHANHQGSALEKIYSISYWWYTWLGLIITVFVGVIVSFATGYTPPKEIDRKYILPAIAQISCFGEDEKDFAVENAPLRALNHNDDDSDKEKEETIENLRDDYSK